MANEYDIILTPLSDEEGGGFMGIVPDLQGCMSDGETREEALTNTVDAIDEWLEMNDSLGREKPQPGWAVEHVRQRHNALTNALEAMAQYVSRVDDELDQKIADLHKRLDEVLAWLHAMETGDRDAALKLSHVSAFATGGALRSLPKKGGH